MIRPARDTAAAGGDAELQTDVMRFFAILAICVIALTSLVENVDRHAAAPRQPAPETSSPVAAPPQPPVPDTPASAGSASREVSSAPLAAPAPAAPDERRLPLVASREPLPESATRSAELPASPASADRIGPSLRFASPQAMLRLVSNGQVRVFAAVSGRGYRLARDGRRFVPESLPPALYLMAQDTIPEALARALARDAVEVRDATWGVTLSDAIRRRLARAVNAGADGLLPTDAAGRGAPAGGQS